MVLNYSTLTSRPALMGIIAVLLFIIVSAYFGKSDVDVSIYENRIEELNVEIDSLKQENRFYSQTVDSLKVDIGEYKTKVNLLNTRIHVIKKQTQQQINNVDSFGDDELEEFFTNRYNKDSIN